jgi:hypothetical protein
VKINFYSQLVLVHTFTKYEHGVWLLLNYTMRGEAIQKFQTCQCLPVLSTCKLSFKLYRFTLATKFGVFSTVSFEVFRTCSPYRKISHVKKSSKFIPYRLPLFYVATIVCRFLSARLWHQHSPLSGTPTCVTE